jgi:uncharacterized protein (TIGR03118 family)
MKSQFRSDWVARMIAYPKILTHPLALILPMAIVLNSCKSSTDVTTNTPSAYQATYLVSDVSGFNASRTDANLLNAWGIGVTPSGTFWIVENHDSSAVNYDQTGAAVSGGMFAIPKPDGSTGGAPSGLVFNTTNDFGGAKVIVSTEDGSIAAWSAGASAAIKAVSASGNGVYKGLAMASDGGANFLYATNFHDTAIDVFDKNFHLVSGKPFVDPNRPAGYGPFGIQNIGGLLYVTYALRKLPDMMDDSAGPGRGIVDVFSPNGTLLNRFATSGTLNSPWGIAMSGGGFGTYKQSILVGDFGDGAINAFDSTGKYLGQLADQNNAAISVGGLWGISFNNNAGDPNFLYFTAGPNGENDGAFGYVHLK